MEHVVLATSSDLLLLINERKTKTPPHSVVLNLFQDPRLGKCGTDTLCRTNGVRYRGKIIQIYPNRTKRDLNDFVLICLIFARRALYQRTHSMRPYSTITFRISTSVSFMPLRPMRPMWSIVSSTSLPMMPSPPSRLSPWRLIS